MTSGHLTVSDHAHAAIAARLGRRTSVWEFQIHGLAAIILASVTPFALAEKGSYAVNNNQVATQQIYATEKQACEEGAREIVQLPLGTCIQYYPAGGCYAGLPENSCTGLGRPVFIVSIDCGISTPVTTSTNALGQGSATCNSWQRNTRTNVGESCRFTGNPCDVATGNKYEVETDYRAADGQLQLVRYYNSFSRAGFRRFGPNWTDYYTRSLIVLADSVRAERPSGRVLRFLRTGQDYTLFDVGGERLEAIRDGGGAVIGWRLSDDDANAFEEYDANGRLLFLLNRTGLTQQLVYSDASTPTTIAPGPGLLIQVLDAFGRSLNFTYNSYGFVASVTDPAGQVYNYTYNAVGNVSAVGAAGGTLRSYLYENSQLPYNLTGITDENGARFATWTYAADGRAVTSEHAGGAELKTLTFNSDGTTTVREYVNAASYAQRVLGFQTTKGLALGTTVSGDPGASRYPVSITYDSTGYPASRVDWNGNRTDYVHDTAGLEIQRTEGLASGGGTTPQTRIITTEWHPTFRLVARVAEPLRLTTYVYNGDGGAQCGYKSDHATLVPGVMCSKTVQATGDANGSQGLSAVPTGAPRAWTYTYSANGRVLTVDGPRTDVSDVTTYAYYTDDDPDLGKRGNIATITNAAGHVTEITAYNADGQPTTIVDPNGLTTTLTYDARQRLTSRTVGSETTGYEYDGVGQLTKVTLPDGSFLFYSYDSAHRLTGMRDSLGNRIAYTLDVMGNRTQEQVFDPASNLAQTRSRVYSNLNRLVQEIGAAGQVTEYTYDDQGNVSAVRDPLNHTTTNGYDALNRLARVTDPASGVTTYGYNGLDALTLVADPRGLVTGYMVDGLGNLAQQVSPDTGITDNSYDAGGNLLTQTDAKGQVTAYAYDSLNRVASITFHDGSKQIYAYDQGTNGRGRLSSITETDPAQALTSQIAYAYDRHGRVTAETRIVAGQSYVTAYSYDSAGRMSGMRYPSGRTVAYAYDALGRISQVTTTSSQIDVVVQSVQYHPFGGVKGFTFGNGQVYARRIDQDGRVTSYSLGGASYAISFDAASRITGIAELGDPSNTNTYGYDNLDRLTSAVLPSSGFGYSYDAVGNRLSKSVGATVHTYTYSATSNRIASIQPTSGPVRSFVFDANGSTTADGLNTYAYDTRGRMVQAMSSIGTTAYQVNALGQRVRKTNALGDTVFHYDTRGHLIAETDPAGATRREIIYLGDIPVGVVQ